MWEKRVEFKLKRRHPVAFYWARLIKRPMQHNFKK